MSAMFKDIVPKFDEDDIKRDTRRKSLRTGTYKFRVTGVTQKVNDKGNMVLSLKLAPLDANGNVRSPGAFHSLVGPFKTDPELLALAQLPSGAQKDVPNTAYLIERYGRARQNSSNPTPVEFPVMQTLKEIGSKWCVVDESGIPTGEALEAKSVRDEKKTESGRAARKFYQWAWSTGGEALIGDEFYGTVSYDTKPNATFDGAQVEISKSQNPATILDMVDMTADILHDAA